MSVDPTPDVRALGIAARQHSAISITQLLAAGLSRQQAHDRVRSGRFRRPVSGVYVVAGAPETAMQRVWVAYLAVQRAGGVVSHMTAAALHGIRPFPLLPHVTVPPGASHRARAGKVHRGRIDALDAAWHEGLRLTNPSRTLVDLATCLDRPALEDATDQLFCERKATAESTMHAADRAGERRWGKELLRSVVEVWTPEIEPGSVAEVRLLRQLVELGAPDVVTQHPVFDAAGRFVGRLDVAVPALRAGLEYDGVRHHSPRHWSRDEPRYAALAAAGWAVDAVSKLDLLPGEPRLRDLVARWTARRAA